MNLASWNQNAWCAVCQGNEVGVCRALVLIWLFLGGEVPPPNPSDSRGAMYTALLQRIMGSNVATFGVNVLQMQWKGAQGLLPKVLPKVNVAGYILDMNAWPARFVIGIGTESAGHAIGLVLSQNRCHFFDPNTGYGSRAPQEVVDQAITYLLVYAKEIWRRRDQCLSFLGIADQATRLKNKFHRELNLPDGLSANCARDLAEVSVRHVDVGRGE